MNVVEENQVEVSHNIYLCTVKVATGAGTMPLMLQRQTTSPFSQDTEIKSFFKQKVFMDRQTKRFRDSFHKHFERFCSEASKVSIS